MVCVLCMLGSSMTESRVISPLVEGIRVPGARNQSRQYRLVVNFSLHLVLELLCTSGCVVVQLR